MALRQNNPYAYDSGIGQSLASAAHTLMSSYNPGLMDARRQAAALHAAQMDKLQREGAAQAGIAGVFSRLTPRTFQAAAPNDPGAIETPDDLVNAMRLEDERPAAQQTIAEAPSQIASYAAQGGMDPDKVGKLYRAVIANVPGSTDSQIARSVVGSGNLIPAGNGVDAVSLEDRGNVMRFNRASDIAKTIASEQAKPVNVGEGNDVYLAPGDPRGGGQTVLRGRDTLNTVRGGIAANALKTPDAPLTPLQAAILGNAHATPHDYMDPNGNRGLTLDGGLTDAHSHAPLPQGTQVVGFNVQTDDPSKLGKSPQNDLQKADASLENFRTLLKRTYDSANGSPESSFGAVGDTKRIAQDIVTQLNASKDLNGAKDAQDAVSQIRSKLIGAAGIGSKFDTELSNMPAEAVLLTYAGASALAGQSNRSVSDKDFAIMKDALGDPHAWMTSKEKYLGRLRMADQIATDYANVGRRRLQMPEIGPALGGGQAPAAQGSPAAAGGAPQGAPVQVWGRDASGRPVPVQ